MSMAAHHAEWLSLMDVSGPFLSVSVLVEALPNGLDTHDPSVAAELRAAGAIVTEAVGTTGVVGIMRNGAGPVIMVRAGVPAGSGDGVREIAMNRV